MKPPHSHRGGRPSQAPGQAPGTSRPANQPATPTQKAPPRKPPTQAPRPAGKEGREDRPPRPAKDRTFRIAGLPAVAAVFATAPERVERLYFEPGIGSRASAFCKTLAAAKKPYKQVPPDELAKIAGTPMHGSIVAMVTPQPLAVIDRACAMQDAKAWARAGDPLLVLDNVSNPHNLGAIARTAAFFGVKRLLLSDHPSQALPSDAVYRVARGGLDYLEVLVARDFQAVVRALSPDYLVVGAALGKGQPPEAYAGNTRPLALVMGNEEHGLSAETLAACTSVVTIPGAGSARVQSLNVAASSAILIHALLQRPGKPPVPS